MDDFTEGYIECALWSSTHTDGEGNDLGHFDEIDAEIAEETQKQFDEDCADFQSSFAELLEQAYANDTLDYSPARAGHDFWLTRNGHGAGFWDRGLGEVGDKLTEMAKAYGSRDLYLGDDGKIYQG